MKPNFSINQRIKSFKYALNGLKLLLKHEHNAWIHSFAAIVVVGCGLFFGLSANEWIVVLFSIGLVFVLELINSAIEQLCNAVSLDYHPLIKNAKDLSAGAVFIAALVAAIAGLIVFLPKVVAYVNGFLV
jgi:diacylglycerol kinase